MANFFLTINAWHWLGLAAMVFIIEILTGTGFLLWMGISATVVAALLSLFTTMTIVAQALIFSFIALLTALLGRIYFHYHPIKTDKPRLNRRAEQYIGREFTLKAPIINKMGTIEVDDSLWRLKSKKNLAAGTKIRIVDAEGVILVAEEIKD